jgi:hypothetical protein
MTTVQYRQQRVWTRRRKGNPNMFRLFNYAAPTAEINSVKQDKANIMDSE